MTFSMTCGGVTLAGPGKVLVNFHVAVSSPTDTPANFSVTLDAAQNTFQVGTVYPLTFGA